jgi:hypothetical protein
MLDALIMTLGFEPGSLVSAAATAATEGLGERARIIVFTAALPDERAGRAWLDFQRVLNVMGVVLPEISIFFRLFGGGIFFAFKTY